jgi:hypothetical protein
VGPHLGDRLVLRVARALEVSRTWRDVPATVVLP